MNAKLVTASFLALFLGACGGGGHSHNSSTDPNQPHDGYVINTQTGQFVYGISLGGNLYLDPTTGQTFFGFEKNVEVSKDLEKVGAVMSKAQTRQLGEQIAANYGLSESRGIEVAGLMMAYSDLKATRALTAADQDRFAVAMTGSTQQELQQAADAYSAGKTGDIDALVQKAASANGTTPENVRDILSQLLQ